MFITKPVVPSAGRSFPIVLGSFWATFCGSSNPRAKFAFLNNYWAKIGLEHISSTKKSTISFIIIIFCLTDVSSYCEERKIKLLINVYIKISRNLGGNFWNLGSNFRIFANYLATFGHSSEQLSSILRAQSGKAYAQGYLAWVRNCIRATSSAHAQQRSYLIKWGVFLEYTKIEQVKYKLFWQSVLFIHCYFIPRTETWDVWQNTVILYETTVNSWQLEPCREIEKSSSYQVFVKQ